MLENRVDTAWQYYKDGEISLGEMGEVLLDDGYSPKEVRILLSRSYPIPVGYFGEE